MMRREVTQQKESSAKLPPRQQQASFDLDAVMLDLEAAGNGRNR